MLRHNEEINNRNRDWNAGDKKMAASNKTTMDKLEKFKTEFKS